MTYAEELQIHNQAIPASALKRRTYLEPGSPEWLQVITPSKVAAILGVSRWESAYRLWHRMKGLTPQEPERDIFDIGHDYEHAAAAIYRRQHPGWLLSPGEVQIRQDGLERFGYPAAATLDRRARRGRARRVVEFKTARHLEEWGDLFTDQAPADYVAQILAQMAYTGYTRHAAHLLVIGPYFDDHTYVIEYNEAIVSLIHARCKAFWESLAGDQPPVLDDTVATYECVREQHPDIEKCAEVWVDARLAASTVELSSGLKEYEAALRGHKTRLLDAMGRAQYAYAAGPDGTKIKVADRRPHGRGGVALNLATKNLAQLIEAADNEMESNA